MTLPRPDETFAIYPKVKGIQVMNDMGQHMYNTYAGKWIPTRRDAAASSWTDCAVGSSSATLAPWRARTHAIRTYTTRDRRSVSTF